MELFFAPCVLSGIFGVTAASLAMPRAAGVRWNYATFVLCMSIVGTIVLLYSVSKARRLFSLWSLVFHALLLGQSAADVHECIKHEECSFAIFCVSWFTFMMVGDAVGALVSS